MLYLPQILLKVIMKKAKNQIFYKIHLKSFFSPQNKTTYSVFCYIFSNLFFPMWLFSQSPITWQTQQTDIKSKNLDREVRLTVLTPFQGKKVKGNAAVLLVNDGQDFPQLNLVATLERLCKEHKIPPVLVVGIHCNHDRMNEYGTASQADYKNRGNKAKLHTLFVLEELLPYLHKNYDVKKDVSDTFFAGFSLGGLSALDIVWHHPEVFSKVGVFSGSLWWRKNAYEDNYKEDSDRIMHNLVREGTYKKNMKFWLEVGTEDELEDRNNNGIIDAIDDTVDLMKELHLKGYKYDTDMTYYEIKGGKHNPAT